MNISCVCAEMPVDIRVCQTGQDLAWTLCQMLYKEGQELQDLVTRAGILFAAPDGMLRLNRGVLKQYFVDHVVVCEGHWVKAYWPRGRVGEHVYKVCTCLHHVLHAECEHVLFAGALCGGPPNLNNVPVVRPRGRKRIYRR